MVEESGNAVTLLQALVGSFVGLTISLGTIKLMIWKGNKETKDELKKFEGTNADDHKIMFTKLEEHNITINRYTSNESFYKAIETVAQDGVNIVVTPEENNGLDIGCYIQEVSEAIKEFAKDVLIIGVDEISDEFVCSKISAYKAKIRPKCEESFGRQNSIKLRSKHNPILRSYTKDVKNISNDVCNDREGRFRDITVVFLRKTVSNIVRFGLSCNEKM